MSCRLTTLLTILVVASHAVAASSRVSGEIASFSSPNGVQEQCIILDPMPGGTYSKEDKATEQRFCAIDFNADTVAVCPKLFSTSPGTLIYDISSGPYAGNPAGFERDICPKGKILTKEAAGAPVSFKTTMNAKETSATFSTASLLYYHFSRYFDMATHVPVSTYRSMDKEAHLQRVTSRGVQLSAHKHALRMNNTAWRTMESALRKPESYRPTSELFTTDRKQIYGILIQPQGKRYSSELNGTRDSGWGEGQSRDFMETAPFIALRSEKPLADAIESGLTRAKKNAKLRKAMGSHVSNAQMVFWMQELTEITLLDFIFSQQDRIGNIDYISYWYWLENGEVKRRPAHGRTVPADIADFNPVSIERTQLNDNDAGGKIQYANYDKKTGMLEKIRHYHPDTYTKLLQLNQDFQAKGKLYDYVVNTFGLSDKQIQQIIRNTNQATKNLQASCAAGKLRFDLDAEQYLRAGKVEQNSVNCTIP